MKKMKPQARRFQLTVLFLLLALSGLSIFASKNSKVFRGKKPDNRSSEITACANANNSPRSNEHRESESTTIAEPAQSGGNFNVTRSVVAGGGGASSSGAIRIEGTVGQSAGATSTGGSYSIGGGFWGGAGGGCPTIAIAPGTLPNGQTGQPYTLTLTASGGVGPHTFTIIAGAPPPNLTLAPGGVISGTPAQSGSFPITVKATDQNGCMGAKDYTLMIGACPNITLTPGTLPAGTVGAPYNQPITATGGAPPYTFMISGAALPEGLTLSSGGTISGAPTTAGTFSFTVKAKDANNCEGSQGYTLTVNPPVAGRIIRALAARGAPGAAVGAPIELASQGDENALGFSLNFDVAILSNPQAALGGGAGGASLNVNNSQIAQGRLGLAIALPSGQAFAAGARQVVVVTFTIASPVSVASTPITFGDQPIVREVVDINANTLPTNYVNDVVTINAGYEADVAPRPNGNNNGTVTIADWALVGRFATNLDTPAIGSEWQRRR